MSTTDVAEATIRQYLMNALVTTPEMGTLLQQLMPGTKVSIHPRFFIDSCAHSMAASGYSAEIVHNAALAASTPGSIPEEHEGSDEQWAGEWRATWALLMDVLVDAFPVGQQTPPVIPAPKLTDYWQDTPAGGDADA